MLRRLAWLWVFACGCTAGPVAPAGPSTAAGAAAAPPSLVQPGDLAITDVTVVAMSSDGSLAHRTVVIRGDRIAAVVASAGLALPAGVTRIDGAGKWLMPGLADMHVHAWYDDDLTMFLAAGVTTIRNMWGVEQHLAWRSQIARGERLGPTIITAGALIDGDPPDWPGSFVLTRAEDAEQLVVQQKAAGYDFLKPVARLSREAFGALAAAASRHGMVLSGHTTYAVGLEGVLAAHQRSIEHLDGYLTALVPSGPPLPSIDDGYPRLHAVLARLDPERLPGVIDQTLAAGTWNCPTLVTYDRTPELYDRAAMERRVQWIAMIPAAVREGWAHDYAAQHFTAEDAAAVRATNAQLARVTGALVAANAPILVGTDTANPYVVAGESLHDEIELIVAAGVPRPRVMRAATADAWRYLGQPHEAGVVEVGARADLLLVASDPMTAPLPLIPEGVMVRGRWLPRSDLEARLAEVVKHAAPPSDRWAGAPPLAAEGEGVHRVGYDVAIAGTQVGQERVAVSAAGGKRVIVGQIADFATRIESSYSLGPDTATIALTYHTMTLDLRGKLAGGKLVVTGTDLTGKAVSLSQPAPAAAFVSGPGVGGALRLVDKLAGLQPGSKRTLTSVAVDAYPAIAIASTRYVVERKRDRGGHRVFAVTATQRDSSVAGELVVDATGFVVAQTLGPPIDTAITRRPE